VEMLLSLSEKSTSVDSNGSGVDSMSHSNGSGVDSMGNSNGGSGNRVGGLSGVGDFSDVAVNVVGVVVDSLDAAVGEVDGVGAGPGSGAVVGLSSGEPGSRVVVGDSVLVGEGGDLVGVHLSGVSRGSMGNSVDNWGMVGRGSVDHRGGMDHRGGVDNRGVDHRSSMGNNTMGQSMSNNSVGKTVSNNAVGQTVSDDTVGNTVSNNTVGNTVSEDSSLAKVGSDAGLGSVADGVMGSDGSHRRAEGLGLAGAP